MLEIRAATRGEVDLLIDWAAAEGWNPGRGDAAAFYAADPKGFIIGLLDGEPVGGVSVVASSHDYGFLGLYIVREAWRGKGLGMQLWRHGMARLGARVVGLDGVLARQGDYARSGFVLAHRNIRFGGRLASPVRLSPRVRAVAPRDADAIAAYDAPLYGTPRRAFLETWLAPADGRRACVLEGKAGIEGYTVARQCREGWKIGPLFADTPAAAEALLDACAPGIADGQVFIDAPEPNTATLAMLRRRGFKPEFETVRMYKGPAPPLPLDRIFGITTFELG